jgi:tRNA1(Val) A37 N6-methylase TrmN6
MNEKCQKFTPVEIVKDMIDLAEYKQDIINKKFLENASGDGVIFLEVLRQYIEVSIKEGYSLEEIKQGIEKNLHAFEIDKKHYLQCKRSADQIASIFGIFDVRWCIRKKDFLKTNINLKYDFIIGNPPYIKYNDLSEKNRQLIVNRFNSCEHGKPDYCYAFIEKSIDILKENGVLVYLIPNSIFKNRFGDIIREKMLTGIEIIRDFTSIYLFEALTHSAIIKFRNNSNKKTINYEDVVDKKTIVLQKKNLGNPWIFDNKYINFGEHKFGEFFKASSAIATLYNKAFLIDKYNEEGNSTLVNGTEIENENIRKAVSLKSLRMKIEKYIIFPYYFDVDGELNKYSPEEFEISSSGTAEHLKKFLNKLENRKSDKNANWFEYGRTQAIKKMNQSKLIVSKIFTSEIKVYELDENTIPYSGNIVIKNSNLPLSIAKDILLSNEFLEYAKKIGTDAASNSHQISAKNINEFKFDIQKYL